MNRGKSHSSDYAMYMCSCWPLCCLVEAIQEMYLLVAAAFIGRRDAILIARHFDFLSVP